MSTLEQEAEMIRLHYAEHWRVGTIATQLSVHPDLVKRVLGLGANREKGIPRAKMVDPYRELIKQTLDTYPKLCATRLHDMIRSRGYRGAVRTLREYVAGVRPTPRREIYLRTEPMPGEQAQVDWAYVGKIPVSGGGERALWLFVMVLSYSRAMWAEFVLDLTVHSLCRSLVRASVALKGVPRQWLFDNPKIVVLERQGDAIRFHPTLLELCGKMRVQPRLCAVARPQHKGKVERSIRYLRDRFLAGRRILSVADGNAELTRFFSVIAHPRPHPIQAPLSVFEVLQTEQERLLSLPTTLPDTDYVGPAPVDTQAFTRFDTNRYSVPSELSEHPLTLVASDTEVRILHGATCVARHERCYGKRQIIELAAHREFILKQRRAARDLKGRDRLCAVAPQFKELLKCWVDTGSTIATQVTRATQLLDLYGEEIFALAVNEVTEKELRDIGALAVICDRMRRKRSQPLPIGIALPSHIQEQDQDVVPHDLGNYDEE
jgi:transposase